MGKMTVLMMGASVRPNNVRRKSACGMSEVESGREVRSIVV